MRGKGGYIPVLLAWTMICDIGNANKERVIHFRDGVLTVYGRIDMTRVERTARALADSAKKMKGSKDPPGGIENFHWVLANRIQRKANVYESDLEKINRDSNRRERGLFNFGGKILKAAFGTPDNEDWDEHDRRIAALEEETVTTAETMDQLVKKVQANTIMEGKLAKVIGMVETHVEDIGNMTQTNSKFIEYGMNTHIIISHKDEILDDIGEHIGVAKAILDDGRHRLLNKEMIPKEDLIDILKDFSSRDGRSPMWGYREAENYYWQQGISTTTMRNGQITTILRIPLIHRDENVRLLETPDGNSKLALEFHNEYYRYMSNGDLERCVDMVDGSKLCAGRILEVKDTSEICTKAAKCRDGISLPYAHIREMQNNEFVYRFREESVATLSCAGHEQREVNLQAAGIVRVGDNCTLSNRNFIIKRRHTEEHSSNYTIEHANWSPEYDPEFMEARMKTVEKDIKRHREESSSINQAIDLVRNDIEAINKTSIHTNRDKHNSINEAHTRIDLWSTITTVHGASSGCLGLLAAILIGWALIKIWRKHKTTAKDMTERNLAIQVAVDRIVPHSPSMRGVDRENNDNDSDSDNRV